ncbi:AlpA family phage regulatory protein [Phytobacter diazotrophicus]|uniref:helix-turn-helix transcriptional regulator n=1 Tax=Phytobacter diazotrophicus TaxID=395631 RepID=UPI001C998E63|nr:AlpA family phage regulatory protein [Phytobacter diazotrophicus]MBY6259696.1 AlpA family phage regulatory protein [Phytobacter diazotrophicus]
MTDNKHVDKHKDDEQQFKLIDLKFICDNTGLSRAFIYKLMSNDLFPKPLKLGRSSRWYLNEFVQWLDERRCK